MGKHTKPQSHSGPKVHSCKPGSELARRPETPSHPPTHLLASLIGSLTAPGRSLALPQFVHGGESLNRIHRSDSAGNHSHPSSPVAFPLSTSSHGESNLGPPRRSQRPVCAESPLIQCYCGVVVIRPNFSWLRLFQKVRTPILALRYPCIPVSLPPCPHTSWDPISSAIFSPVAEIARHNPPISRLLQGFKMRVLVPC